jgi:hypothetical protein
MSEVLCRFQWSLIEVNTKNCWENSVSMLHCHSSGLTYLQLYIIPKLVRFLLQTVCVKVSGVLRVMWIGFSGCSEVLLIIILHSFPTVDKYFRQWRIHNGKALMRKKCVFNCFLLFCIFYLNCTSLQGRRWSTCQINPCRQVHGSLNCHTVWLWLCHWGGVRVRCKDSCLCRILIRKAVLHHGRN